MARLYVTLGILAALGLCWWRYDTVVTDRDLLQTQLTASKGEVKGYVAKVAELKAIEAMDKKVISDYATKKAEVVYVDREVQKEVIKYRDVVVDRFVINPNWLHAYNLSLTAEAGKEGSPGGIDGGATDLKRVVSDADALDTITENNRICVAEILRFKSLQQWVLTL